MKYLDEFGFFINELVDTDTQVLPNQKIFIDKLRGDKPVLVFQYTTEEEKKAILIWMTRSGFKDSIKNQGIDIVVIKADRGTFYVGDDPKNTTVLYKKGRKIKEFFGIHLMRQSQYKWDHLAREVEEALMLKQSPEKWMKSYKTTMVFLYDNVVDRPLFSKFIDAYKTMMKDKFSYFNPSIEFVAVNLRNIPAVLSDLEERKAEGLGSLRDEAGRLRVNELPGVALFAKAGWDLHATFKNSIELKKKMLPKELERKAFKLVEDSVSFL